MVSQSFNLIGQEEEQELVAFETRQSRLPTPQSRPNSRMEELIERLIRIQEEATKSQDATVKLLENRIADNIRVQEEATKSQAEANKSLEAKVSSTDDKLSQIA